jgi:hypothetical protein
VKRHPLGDRPLGRPPGSKDLAPRKRRINSSPKFVVN